MTEPNIRLTIIWEVDHHLDSHLIIYDSSGSIVCHVYWDNFNCPVASLDQDVLIVKQLLNFSVVYYIKLLHTIYQYRPLLQKQLQSGILLLDSTIYTLWIIGVENLTFDDINCVAQLYGFNGLENPFKVPLFGAGRVFVIGCFTNADDFHLISKNEQGTYTQWNWPSEYPSECPNSKVGMTLSTESTSFMPKSSTDDKTKYSTLHSTITTEEMESSSLAVPKTSEYTLYPTSTGQTTETTSEDHHTEDTTTHLSTQQPDTTTDTSFVIGTQTESVTSVEDTTQSTKLFITTEHKQSGSTEPEYLTTTTDETLTDLTEPSIQSTAYTQHPLTSEITTNDVLETSQQSSTMMDDSTSTTLFHQSFPTTNELISLTTPGHASESTTFEAFPNTSEDEMTSETYSTESPTMITYEKETTTNQLETTVSIFYIINAN